MRLTSLTINALLTSSILAAPILQAVPALESSRSVDGEQTLVPRQSFKWLTTLIGGRESGGITHQDLQPDGPKPYSWWRSGAGRRRWEDLSEEEQLAVMKNKNRWLLGVGVTGTAVGLTALGGAIYLGVCILNNCERNNAQDAQNGTTDDKKTQPNPSPLAHKGP